jgi:polyisoprenyl-phosphate glycosyltransferase
VRSRTVIPRPYIRPHSRVDDGWVDGTKELVEKLAPARPRVRAIRLCRNFGKSAALAAGIAHCPGARIVAIDGDGQDSAEIPA